MKAVVCRRYGPPEVIEVAEVDKPVVPDDGVLVRVHASSINPLDMFSLSRVSYLMRMLSQGLRPRQEVLGTDFAGTVESVGHGVTQFQPGDEVFGAQRGAFAEYLCVSETGAVVRKPANITFEQAAAVPIAAVTALQAVRDHGHLQQGQRVLINGGSGGVGTFAVQIATAFGGHVTAVCSATNVGRVRSIGAERVVDYSQEDFLREEQGYDLMLDIAGSRSFSECTRVLAPTATFVAVGASAHMPSGAGPVLRHLAGVRLASLGSSRKVILFVARMNKSDLMALHDLLQAAKVTPVIDRCYPLADVPAALRYLGEGHARGKIVITQCSGAENERRTR